LKKETDHLPDKSIQGIQPPMISVVEAIEKVDLDRIRCDGRKYDSMNQKGGG
jgi:hypothetical protein